MYNFDSLMDGLCPASAKYSGIYRPHLVIDMVWYDVANRLVYQSLLEWYEQVYYRSLDLHHAGRIPADCHTPDSIVCPAVFQKMELLSGST